MEQEQEPEPPTRWEVELEVSVRVCTIEAILTKLTVVCSIVGQPTISQLFGAVKNARKRRVPAILGLSRILAKA